MVIVEGLTVEFTVVGIPCLGLNGGPALKYTEAFHCRSRRTISKRRTIGTRLSAVVVWKARGVGARTDGGLSSQITPRALTDAWRLAGMRKACIQRDDY